MCAWTSVSQFLPHKSATIQSQVLMSMQMDATIIKHNGTLFVRVGALEEGFGGQVFPQGGPPPKVDMPSKNKKLTPSCQAKKIILSD
jgi:hypothetical protein